MKEFIDSVKALGEKMTGKEVEGTGLVDVVDDITEKYEGGGSGGGSGSNYLMTTMDYFQVVGKHIDVNSLISLLEKYDTNLDYNFDPQGSTAIGIRVNDYNFSIKFGYDVCRGGGVVVIFDTGLENLEEASTPRTLLTTNKEKIESFEITENNIISMIGSGTIDNISIHHLDNYVGDTWLTIQEALSIFK